MKTNSVKPNIYDYILGMFLSDDQKRPALTSVFPNEDYYCATDGHVLIAIEKESTAIEYKGYDNFPSALKLIKEHASNETYHFDRNHFLEQFNKAEYIWRKNHKSCEKCSAQGWVECKCCGNESDCKDCDGTGESDEVETFGKLKLEGEDITIFGTRFLSNYINLILQTAFFLEEDTIIIKYQKEFNNKAFLFEIKDATILLMPKI